MRVKEAKCISIGAFLKSQGFHPASIKKNGKELWYSSPIRSGDSTPSFNVDTVKNLWFDFGLNKGGNALDLVCELKNLTVKQALAFLDGSSLLICPYSNLINSSGANLGSSDYSSSSALNSDSSVQQNFLLAGKKEKMAGGGENLGLDGVLSESDKAFQVLKFSPIVHRSMVDFLKSRNVDLRIACKYVSEIHFKPPCGSITYLGVGLPAGDGYEVRNQKFKGFVGTHKGISKINLKNEASLSIFEGFMDFLAFLSFYQKHNFHSSVIILNSVYLKEKAIEEIRNFSFNKVYLFLDNDKTGTVCKQFFMDSIKNIPVIDKSGLYSGFKDFNEMTMRKILWK